ncbi:hypothetical protein OG897_30100 [Streptomyces sp. NBC_00237]|uniref:hypothetical protein n=1 Tax=Streptomyces sp. NBC_00237 TaxID=2975687 RepID=UPI00224D6552|nr:hypothetical protein [Streptomyces sp. NBC_00237]MCX5205693.1 hypothetical protein [Streptomyces sp. NBC_00237]
MKKLLLPFAFAAMLAIPAVASAHTNDDHHQKTVAADMCNDGHTYIECMGGDFGCSKVFGQVVCG